MSGLEPLELKPLLPALNFNRAKRFYMDLGFHCDWSEKDTACLRLDAVAFILHSDYMAVVAENTCMTLEVADVAAWWRHVHGLRLGDVYGVSVSPLSDAGPGRREFTLTDPSGVRWRIGGADSTG